MLECRTKIHDNGRLVVPLACRQALGLGAGEDVILRIEQGELRLYPAKQALTRAKQLVKKYMPRRKLVDELLLERRKEGVDE